MIGFVVKAVVGLLAVGEVGPRSWSRSARRKPPVIRQS